MTTFLYALHSIAARRGDGLRPEFLGAVAPTPARPGLERAAVVSNENKAPGRVRRKRAARRRTGAEAKHPL
ncbi:MAG: hypothetical protein J0I98_16185 [Mesorhizobium sp.]|nr:hypothetical protein [Mesorhizobium sp.]MBN9244326.1 hypothetical protein [Mesorhizobium sp.]